MIRTHMTSGENLEKIWQSVLGELEVELGKSNFGLYFKNSQLLSLENSVAKLGFSNPAVGKQADQRYYTVVQTALQKAAKIEKLSLVFETIQGKQPATGNQNIGPLFEAPKQDREAIAFAIKHAGLRRDFVLEEFCVSTSNQLAFAAAQAVIKSPGKNYNPLFIWGGVGVGKTHLMQAIGHELLRQNPRLKVIYASGEQFTNEIIAGIRRQNTADFKEKYRSADALLIDDIQFLSGKDTAQEEFFHTFNAIQQREGQIVMTSDRKPADIKDLADRLRSRFEGGLVADISTPDSELKTAICILKARKRGIELSTSTAESLVNSVDNIRSLEGALQRVTSEAEVKKTPITEEFVAAVLKLPVPGDQPPITKIDGRQILDLVCHYYNLPMKLLKSEKRDKPISEPRQILMYLLKINTRMTYMEIASFLNRADHTTIIHGVKKITGLLATNERITKEIKELQQGISG